MLERYSSGSQTVNHENNWKKLLVAIARIVAVYSVLCIAMITLSFHFIIPLFRASLPVFWANLAGTVFYYRLHRTFLACHYHEKKTTL